MERSPDRTKCGLDRYIRALAAEADAAYPEPRPLGLTLRFGFGAAAAALLLCGGATWLASRIGELAGLIGELFILFA